MCDQKNRTMRKNNCNNIHSIQIWGQFSPPKGNFFLWGTFRDDAVIPLPDSPKSDNVPVKLPCFVKPLFPSPSRLFLAQQKGSSSHHYGQLVRDSSLKGVYQDSVQVNPTVCLG